MYVFFTDSVKPTVHILFFPLLVILMAGIGLGFGLIFSALTTKYRDLKFLLQFGIQLVMYATPVIYPISSIPEKYKIYFFLIPLLILLSHLNICFLTLES